MTITPYDPAQLDTSATMRVRFWAGDTTAPYRFHDEEIELAIDLAGADDCMAAVDLIRRQIPVLSAGGQMSRSIGDLSISGGDGGAEAWNRMAAQLEERCRERGSIPLHVTYGSREMMDRGHIFEVGQFDHPDSSLPPFGGPPLPQYP